MRPATLKVGARICNRPQVDGIIRSHLGTLHPICRAYLFVVCWPVPALNQSEQINGGALGGVATPTNSLVVDGKPITSAAGLRTGRKIGRLTHIRMD